MPEPNFSDAHYQAVIERYLAGQMSAKEKNLFLLQAARDPQLQEQLRMYRAVEKTMRNDKERAEAMYRHLASTRPSPFTAAMMAMREDSSHRRPPPPLSRLGALFAFFKISWAHSATGGITVGIKTTALVLLVGSATTMIYFVQSSPKPAPLPTSTRNEARRSSHSSLDEASQSLPGAVAESMQGDPHDSSQPQPSSLTSADSNGAVVTSVAPRTLTSQRFDLSTPRRTERAFRPISSDTDVIDTVLYPWTRKEYIFRSTSRDSTTITPKKSEDPP